MKSYKTVDYLFREEEGFSLLFIPISDRCYVINKTDKFILDLLKNGANILEIASKISARYCFEALEDCLAFVNNYLELLENENIISESSQITCSPAKSLPSPELTALEFFEFNGKQCPTFGMPKRSCKSLPSGVYSR